VPRPTRPLGNNTVTIVRAPLVADPRDTSLYRDWDNATSTEVANCMVEPFPLAEKLNHEENRDREFSRSAVRVYMPEDSDVLRTDRMVFDGDQYEIFGHPGRWFDPRGVRNHIAVIARIREG
jgi:hypothetical protein